MLVSSRQRLVLIAANDRGCRHHQRHGSRTVPNTSSPDSAPGPTATGVGEASSTGRSIPAAIGHVITLADLQHGMGALSSGGVLPTITPALTPRCDDEWQRLRQQLEELYGALNVSVRPLELHGRVVGAVVAARPGPELQAPSPGSGTSSGPATAEGGPLQTAAASAVAAISVSQLALACKVRHMSPPGGGSAMTAGAEDATHNTLHAGWPCTCTRNRAAPAAPQSLVGVVCGGRTLHTYIQDGQPRQDPQAETPS